MDNIAPCKNCTSRSLGCHARCSAYRTWKDKYSSADEKRKLYATLNSIEIDRAKKFKGEGT